MSHTSSDASGSRRNADRSWLSSRTPSVLVADDVAESRALLRRLLEAEGYHVTAVADGAEALDHLTRTTVDLALLDVMMPSYDGFEVCHRIKSDDRTRLTPVVLVTGLHAIPDRVRGIEVGADDFIVKPFEMVELLARVRSLIRLKSYTDQLEQSESVLLALAETVEGRDTNTHGHCVRLAAQASRLGEELGLSSDEVTALRRAGYVHDLGKIAIPDAILLKTGTLTDEEQRIMRKHPEVGERICRGLQSFRLVLPIIRHHHEKLDGSGYPDGLAGDNIPLTARVLQVVDVYDALTTPRPYRGALSVHEAFRILEAETTRGWWDPDVVGVFVRLRGLGRSGPAGSGPA